MDEEFDPQAFISGSDTATDTIDESDDPYKKALTQKILSGATDYTYGPGSPGATPADMRQKTGSHDNPLQTGDIALPQKDYELFTPDERKKLGIADTSWIKEGQPTPRGSVERYFGPEAGAFDPQRFIKRQDLKAPDATVPDINAFMEPAPTDTPEGETKDEPTPAEVVGGAISKAASKYGAALANRPKLDLTPPQFQPPAIPQVPQPQQQVIPGQGMIGAAIPTAQPLPTPALSLMPDDGKPIPGAFFHNLGILAGDTGTELKQMVNAPVELSQQALDPKRSIPSRLAAAAGVVASAAQLDPLVPHAGVSSKAAITSTREVPVPEALQPKGAQPEVITGPANKYSDGKIFYGNPGQLHEEINPPGYQSEVPETGWATNKRPFVDREEGHRVATQAKQISEYKYQRAADQRGVEPDELEAQSVIDAGGFKQPQGLPVKAASVQGLKNPPLSRIKEAAIRLPDGRIISGRTHPHITSHLSPEDLDAWVKHPREENTGFVTEDGEYLDRKQALKRAVETKEATLAQLNDIKERQFPYGKPVEELHASMFETARYKRQPPTPPGQPPQGPPPQNPPTAPALPEDLNPVPGSGKFRRSYRVDKSMGDQMEGIGAARESGYLRAELQSRNMLHELSPKQEADLGTLLVSDRLKTVNPNHPQVIFDSVARGIESDPAIAKALDYYKKEIKPEIEALRKRAGLSAKAAAGKQAGFISLIVKNPEPLVSGGIMKTGRLGRTTKFAKLAEGNAKEYSTNLREILAESYSEALKKARVREFYDSTIAKGITEDGTYEELPPPLQHDLTAATQPELNQMPIQSNPNFGLASKLGDMLRAAGRGYQRVVTGFALTANPAELMNHMRRQLNLVAAKPPVGMGVMARLEALLPYFGPKLGAFKRVVMDDMSTLQNQSILKDIFDAGGGSSRSFGERYESHIPGLRQVQKGTQKLLFGVPRGRGVGGWDLRMRVQLEKMRRSVEGNVDPQRIREFANQIGQYGAHPDWFVRGLLKINPYAGTSIPMRITELKTLFGQTGFKEPLSGKALLRAETILRGTGGTLIAMATINYLLSGKWSWQNDAGHEFDINTGVNDKKGKRIYLKTRAFAPEVSRPISTLSVPDVLRERKARHPQYLAAGMTGPANQALSLVSGPGQNLAFTAATGKVPYLLKRPGEGPEFMDVAKLKKGEAAQGVSRGGRQLLKALSSINPLGERLASQQEEDAPGALGYLEEPIPGVRPFGDIFSTSYESRSGGGYSRSTSTGRGGGGRSSGRGQGGR